MVHWRNSHSNDLSLKKKLSLTDSTFDPETIFWIKISQFFFFQIKKWRRMGHPYNLPLLYYTCSLTEFFPGILLSSHIWKTCISRKRVCDDEMVTIVRPRGCLLTLCWFLYTCKIEICHLCEPAFALALDVSLYNQFPLLLCVISQMHILRLHKTLCTCTYITYTWSL